MLKMHNTFVLPHINYYNVVWGSAQPTILKPLIISQKGAQKVAYYNYLNVPRPSSIVFSQAKVLTINNIHELQTCIFMYNYLHNILPESFSSMYVYNNEIQQHDTRCAPQFHVPRQQIEILKQTISYRDVLYFAINHTACRYDMSF